MPISELEEAGGLEADEITMYLIFGKYFGWLEQISGEETGYEFTAEGVAYAESFLSKEPSEQFIEDEKRAEINEAFAPLSVDMDTASVAHVCCVNNVPFLVVRIITDTAAHTGMENFEMNCVTASTISAEIVLGLLTQLP